MSLIKSTLSTLFIVQLMILHAFQPHTPLKYQKRYSRRGLPILRGGSLDLGNATRTIPITGVGGSTSRMIPTIIIHIQPNKVEVEQTLVSKYDLSSELNCPLRDLHFIDNPIPTVTIGTSRKSTQQFFVLPNACCFLVRKNYIILHMDHVRLLIRTDPNEILLFPSPFDNAERALLQDLVRDTVQQIRATPEGKFPLIAIDATLSHISSRYATKAEEVLSIANELLDCIHPSSQFLVTTPPSDKKKPSPKENFMERQRKLWQLLQLKNRVDELESNVADIAADIADILKEDEDMSIITHLGSQSPSAQDPPDAPTRQEHIEVELLLEDYLLQMEGIRHSLRSIQSNILNTEEVIDIELDLIRNRIMQYEVMFSVAGLVVGMAAAVTGLFGMNLLSHLEFHLDMFYRVTVGLVVGMAGLAFVLFRRLMADNIW